MEDNKLIAEFMQKGSEGFGLYDFDGCHYRLDELEFQTSGEWLKPVVEKIEDYLYDNVGKVGYFDECLSSNNLDVRYKAVVEFIKTYNDGRM